MEERALNDRETIHTKSRGETIDVYVGEYQGKKYLHIREWYKDTNDNEMKPTKKGIAIPLEADKITKLQEAIEKYAGEAS